MRKANSRDKIKRAVIKAAIKSGIDGIKIKDISKISKKSEALIFKYYEDKEELIRKTFEDIAIEFYNYIKSKVENSSDKINAFIDSFIDFALSKKEEFLFILKMFQFHYDKFIRKVPKPIDILREIAPSGKYNKQYTIAFIVSILTRMLEFYINGQINDNPENFKKIVKEVISAVL
ncbi:MAG: hypothetical protein ABIL49_06235 [candidate division WOR-3 bacterium]|jgi:AcrR family transcriptional regulator